MDWSHCSYRNRRAHKLQLEKKLVDLYIVDPSDDTLLDSINVHLELNWEVEKEEIYLEQLARVNWLKHGDINTTFFINRLRCVNGPILLKALKTSREDGWRRKG